jgi:hypothetical protein
MARKQRPTSAQATPVSLDRPFGGSAIKLDHGKAPWHLAPWDAFLAIVMVLAFGAQKYRERGWEEGMAWHRCYSAGMRHLTDWFMRVDKGRGPGCDADTGYSDLWHAGCCVCFLIAYEMRGLTTIRDPATLAMVEADTRPHVPRLPMPEPPQIG